MHFLTVENPNCKPVSVARTRRTPLIALPAVCPAMSRQGATCAPGATEASRKEAVSEQLKAGGRNLSFLDQV